MLQLETSVFPSIFLQLNHILAEVVKRYVTQSYANTHPKTTFTEKPKPSNGKK